jgi:hypothetical protein
MLKNAERPLNDNVLKDSTRREVDGAVLCGNDDDGP